MVNHASCGGVDSRKTRGTCTSRQLSQLLSVMCLMCPRLDAKLLLSRVSLEAASLFLRVEVRPSTSYPPQTLP
ncbi:hypothetical protein HanIR_Chr05g0249651 [Helianthus annuus]|nr:hypothetical protein HanIR_Chr05g0249651 [Helianthus annuus]